MKKRKNKKNIADMARKAGIPKGTVYARLKLGWSLKKALNTPVSSKFAPKPKKDTPKAETKKVERPAPTKGVNNPVPVEVYKGTRDYKPALYLIGTIIISTSLLFILLGG